MARTLILDTHALCHRRANDSLNLILEMHDRQIVATTLSMCVADPSAVLVSMDRQIKESGLVAMLW
jgi:hypothetical protein